MDFPQMDPILKAATERTLKRKALRDCYKLYRYYYGEKIDKIEHVEGRIQNYMREHPNDDITKIIKEWVYKQIKAQYLNKEYINALNMSNEFKYTKLLEISKQLPFHYNFGEMYYHIYYLLDRYDTYEFHKEHAKNLHDGEIPDELFDKTIEFVENNRLIAFATREEYDDEEAEFKHLKEFTKNRGNTEDFIKNISRVKANEGSWYKYVSDDETIDAYEREKKGRVGEYFIYNWLKTQSGKTTFVAKEYGNGFGYDILYNDPVNQKEYLVEVKSTTNSLERDSYFSLTDNEVRVLNDTLTLPKSEFIIERVYIDLNQKENKNHKHYALYYDKDNKCFINNTDNPEYYIKYIQNKNDPLRFDKVLVKKNILTYKNNNQ